MSAADDLLNLAEQPIGQAITLHPKRCLNSRFRAVDCTLCADACPADGAIVVTEGQPALDNDACWQCGLCLHYCPTEAFTRPDSLWGKLVKTVAALPSGPVDLVCPQHSAPDCGPAPLAVQTKRCLAGLSPATLLELSTLGHELWLDDTFCANCPLGEIQPRLKRTVAEANGWRSLLDNTSPVLLRTAQKDGQPLIDRPVFEADHPPISRRGFFGSLKHLKQEAGTAGETIEPGKSSKAVPVSERLPHFVPRQRAKILSIIDKKQDPVAPLDDPQLQPDLSQSKIKNQKSKIELPVADVAVNASQCSACGLCARFCPTGALKFLSDDEQFALSFQATLCLGERCNICVVACPEKAVSITPIADLSELLVKKPRYLVAGELMSCQECGGAIAKGPERSTRCFVCRSRHQVTFNPL